MERKYWRYVILLIILDQLTKHIVVTKMFLSQVIPITSFFQITFVTNTGISFGMFDGNNFLFIFLTLFVLCFFYFWFLKNIKESAVSVYAFVLIFAGAVGNLIDRIIYGHVIDFLEFHITNHFWPAFNIADSCITIGGVILFISVFMRRDLKSHTAEIKN